MRSGAFLKGCSWINQPAPFGEKMKADSQRGLIMNIDHRVTNSSPISEVASHEVESSKV